jgi:hypothetical protein
MDMVHTGRSPFYLTADQQYVVLCACPPRGDLVVERGVCVSGSWRFCVTCVCACVCVCVCSLLLARSEILRGLDFPLHVASSAHFFDPDATSTITRYVSVIKEVFAQFNVRTRDRVPRAVAAAVAHGRRLAQLMLGDPFPLSTVTLSFFPCQLEDGKTGDVLVVTHEDCVGAVCEYVGVAACAPCGCLCRAPAPLPPVWVNATWHTHQKCCSSLCVHVTPARV